MTDFDITKAPLVELLNDRAESLADIQFCERMGGYQSKLARGYAQRAEINRKIVEEINAELERRESEEVAS